MAKSEDKQPAQPATVLPFGKKPLRTFAFAVALPMFLLYVLGATLVVGALAFMARDIDQLEDRRGITAMHAALSTFLNDLSNAVSDEGTWNEAYLNVVSNSDPAWMDTTWGSTARMGLTYDNVLVTDATGEIVFGENNLGQLKGNISSVFAAAPAMLGELDKAIVTSGDAAAVSDFASDPHGMAGVAAISIHQSTPGAMTVPKENRRILWIARHVTDGVLQDISTHYQLPLADLVDVAGDDASSIQLSDAGGKFAGTIAWVPERPGGAAFDRALLVATGIFFVIGLALAVFLGVLRRAIMRRAAAAPAETRHVEAGPAAAAAAEHHPRRAASSTDDHLPEFGSASPSDFTIEYQPVFDVRAEALVGVEALLRWRLAGNGVLAQENVEPRERLALFDRAGLFAIRHATGELAPLIGTTLTIAVTPKQLQSPEFAEKTVGTLGATGFPARRLLLALDCSTLPALDTIREAVSTLRQAGVHLVLDGFAPSIATADVADPSFADAVRLAPALTQWLDQSPGRQNLVASTIETLRASGLGITVPGADHKQDVARLLRLGCTEFQGRLFAPPMPVAALMQLVLAPPVKRAS